MALIWVAGKCPTSEFNTILRAFREKGFDATKLPASIADILPAVRKLPLPTVSQSLVDIVRRKNKQVEVVDSKPVYYFDIKNTIRRAFADPAVRQTIDVAPRDARPVDVQSNFLDSEFSRDPSRFSALLTFPIAVEDGAAETGRIGSFVCTRNDGVLLVRKLSSSVEGLITVHGERWRGKANAPEGTRLHKHELKRSAEQTSVPAADVLGLVTVTPRAEFKEANRAYFSHDQPQDVAAQLREVASIPFTAADGRHLFIKLYLDGMVVAFNMDVICSLMPDFSLYRSRGGKLGGLYFTIGEFALRFRLADCWSNRQSAMLGHVLAGEHSFDCVPAIRYICIACFSDSNTQVLT